MNNLIGQQWGSYRLTRLLAQGGFAEVYLAEHTRLNMFAAIKILYTNLPEGNAEAFQNEAQVIANLVHPHIVRLLDFDVKEGRPFLVLDYASNGSLRQRHPKGTPIPLALAVNYTRQIASALQFAHDSKIVHRDVKPENMLLSQQEMVLLSDFGIASIAHSTSSMNVQSSMGTIPYMAPEQIQGQARPASDQYALAAVIYQWLSGDLPFQGNSSEIIAQHLGVEVPPLRKKAPDAPVEVELVLSAALSKDPKARFGSVQAFANALEQASQPVSQPLSMSRTQPQLVQQQSNSLDATSINRAFTSPQMNTPPTQNQTPPASIPLYQAYPTPFPYIPPSPSQPAQSIGKIAFKWGGIFGIILVAVLFIQDFFLLPILIQIARQQYLTVQASERWNTSVHYLIFSVAYFCLGIIASKQNGKIITGVLASLWANLWFIIGTFILVMIRLSQLYTRFSAHGIVREAAVRTLLTNNITSVLVAIALGAGLSALGGLFGKSLRAGKRG